MQRAEQLQTSISKSAGLMVDLIINENRSHLFTVLDRQPYWAKLSVHKMFLEAPEKVVEALAGYVRSFDKRYLSVVLGFIHDNVSRDEYLQPVKRSALVTKGQYFDLEEIFKRVNGRYFESRLKLSITWFKQKKPGFSSRVIFGQYHPLLRLIKINKMLDSPLVPDYFIDFVFFHEMLHHVMPSKTKACGRRSIHPREFKEKERLFADFDSAVKWQESNRHLFFEGSLR